MSEQPTSIAVAVVQLDDLFLAGPRPSGKPLAGLWEFPGGKVQPGEQPADAAVRECREETGLCVEVLGTFPEQVQAYAHGCVRLHFFACRPLEANPRPQPPFAWIERQELARLRFPAGNQELLRQLLG